jgi:hypothetical protein
MKQPKKPPHENVDRVALHAAAAAQAADPTLTSVTVRRYDGRILVTDMTLDFSDAESTDSGTDA